jgi:hypothetical protein
MPYTSDCIEFGVSRDAYNEFVQTVQSEARAFSMEHRIRPTHHDDGRLDGAVEVFWDRWQEVAGETRAMTPECRRYIRPGLWSEIMARAADELVKS